MPNKKQPAKTVDLGFALNLEPQKALEYFRDKGYIVPQNLSDNWQSVWQEAHAKAFTVARCTRIDVLQDIRDALDASLAQGKTFSQFKSELAPTLAKKGWWGTAQDENGKTVMLGSPRRLQTIFDTNINTAYQAGRYTEMIENADNRPFWQYSATMDKRTRPAHAALNDKVFRFDDPFWDSFYPPNGWNCRCRVRTYDSADLKSKKLTVENSSDNLKTEEIQLSSKTKETASVAVYTNPLTDEKTTTDAGWNYNPGKVAYQPNLEKYDYSIAKQYVQGVVTGLPFEVFYKKAQTKADEALKTVADEKLSKGKLQENARDHIYQNMPKSEKDLYAYVGILDEQTKKLLKAEKQSVKFSLESFAKNIIKHSELSLQEYLLIPEIIENTQALLLLEDENKEKIFCYAKHGKYYKAVIKSTLNKQENFLQSFHPISLEGIEKDKKKKGVKIIYDNLP